MKKSILVVDDSVISQSAIKNKVLDLYKNQYTITCLNNGQELYNLIKSKTNKYFNTIELIILDYYMPFHTGGEIAETLYRLGINIPILFVSSIQDEIEKKNLLHLTPNIKGILSKPFSEDLFGEIIKKITSEKNG